jgi:p-hydroxybenzoate 3-monooxygenase
MADVWRLSRAVAAYYQSGSQELLDSYSGDCLQRVWRAQQFSCWMTSLLHKSDTGNPFDCPSPACRAGVCDDSRVAMTSLAENYVGFPIE